MVERHYGTEMVDLLADPLLSGVYGGEATELSVRAVLPRFADMESKHGSLGRAMLAARKKMAAAAKAPPARCLLRSKKACSRWSTRWSRVSIANALQTSSPVQSVTPHRRRLDRLRRIPDRPFRRRHHRDARRTPPRPCCKSADENLARELGEHQLQLSVTVTLGYDEKVRRSLPPGFGFLVPRSAGRRMLAATFVHNKFPHRAPENRAIVRCFLGGARDEQILRRRREDQILANCPQRTAPDHWPQCRASVRPRLQMEVRHGAVFRRPPRTPAAHQSLCQKLPGLALAGNGYNGIGVPDCVRSGTEAASKILAEMGMWSAA